MSVLLVNVGRPVEHAALRAMASPNLGLGYLAAVLLEAGFETRVVDLYFDPIAEDDLVAALPSWDVGLLGLSTITASFPHTVELARRIRSLIPELPIVVGGPHVTFQDEEALATGCFDVVVRFEGEATLRDLARFFLEGHGELAAVEGISFLDGSDVHRTPRRAPAEALDRLPSPARHLAPLEHYATTGVRNVGLVSSRGCPYRCTFCINNAFHPSQRLRSVDDCVRELDALRPLGFDLYHFWDEDLFTRPERVRELMPQIAERGLRWSAAVTATDNVTRSLIEEFRDSGGSSLFLGVESASDEVLASIRRPNRLATILRVTEEIVEAGVVLEVGIIIGHPEDTPASIDKTAALARAIARLGVTVHLTINTPFPGTDQYARADELGLRIVERDWSKYDLVHAVMDTRHLTALEIEGRARSLQIELHRDNPAMQAMLRLLT